jgi:hypothetical protein
LSYCPVYIPYRSPDPGKIGTDPEQTVLHPACGTFDMISPSRRLDSFHTTGIMTPDLAKGPGRTQGLRR